MKYPMNRKLIPINTTISALFLLGRSFWMVSGPNIFLPPTCHDLVGGSPTRNPLHPGSRNDTSALKLLPLADIWYSARREKARTNRYDLREKSILDKWIRKFLLWSEVLEELIQLTRSPHVLSKKEFGSSFVWVSCNFPKFNLAYESCTVNSADFRLEFLTATGYPSHPLPQPDNGGILFSSNLLPRQRMSLRDPGISKEWNQICFI